MPLRLAAAIVLALGSLAAPARADVPKCPRHGPLHAVVAPHGRDPTLARRTLDAIFSELQERTTACPARSQRPIDLEVTWRENGHVLVQVTMQTRTREVSIERDVDLARVPPDGVPLAVAIVADEILAEIFDRVSADPPRVRATLHEAPPAPTASSPPATRRVRFGLEASYEQLTSGLALAGLDVEVAWLATAHFQVGLRAGLRAAASAVGDSVPARGFDVAPLVIVSTDVFAPRGIGALGAVDVLGLGDAARASPALGVLGWQKLGERFVLSGDVRVGGVLGAPSEFSALSGACVTFSIGIGTEW